MFFILISINIIVYIVSVKFMFMGADASQFYIGFILLWVGLFITGYIGSMYVKKAQRLAQLELEKKRKFNKNPKNKSKLNMNKKDKSNLNMNKNNDTQSSDSYFFADCLDCADCANIADVFVSPADCGDCGGMDCGTPDCGGADCGGADCGGADCGGL